MPGTIGVSAKGSSSTSPATTSPGVTTQASGSLLIGLAIWEGSAFTSLADNKSNTFTQLGTEQAFGPGSARIRAYYCANAAGGSGHTLTLTTAAGSIYASVFLVELIGMATSSPLDGTVQQVHDTSSPYAQAITTANADDIIVAMIGTNAGSNPSTLSESSGFTIQQQVTDGVSFYTGGIATRIVSSTGTYTPSFTQTGGGDSAGIIVAAFKAAAAGGTTTTKTMTDTVTLADAALDPVRRVRQMTDTLVTSDSFVKNVIVVGGTVYTKVMTDTLNTSDALVQWLRRVRNQVDTITVSEGTLYRSVIITLDDGIDVSDNVVQWRRLARRTDEVITLLDNVVRSVAGVGLIVTKVMSDSLVLFDGTTSSALRVRQSSDTISTSDAILRAVSRMRFASDAIGFDDGLVRIQRLTRVTTDTLDLPDDLVKRLQLDQLSPVNFRFGAGSVPFVFGSGQLPFRFGSQ